MITQMKIHIIAIGGSIMHNLAIQLKLQGHEVTGSDDLIYEPAHSHLKEHDLLPQKEGWFPDKIVKELDLIIMGKHAHTDNPELQEAQLKNIRVLSFPEFVYERSLNKTRIAIAGSHGKTTTTAMLMETFLASDRDFDYLVGAKLHNFDRSFKLTASARYILLEADEYPSSALDPQPKFNHYKPHYTIITGIAWDHMNAFPTEENYIAQFRSFLHQLSAGSHVIYYKHDAILTDLVKESSHIYIHPYEALSYRVVEDQFVISSNGNDVPIEVIGKHNIENMSAVLALSDLLQLDHTSSLQALSQFQPADRRLQIVENKSDRMGIIDFAHAPSKVGASIHAVHEMNPERNLTAVLELHTYSSLNKDFLHKYRGNIDVPTQLLVYYDPHTLEIKRLPPLSADIIKREMGRDDILVFTTSEQLYAHLQTQSYDHTNLLFMSSGAFGKSNVREWIKDLLA